MSESKLPEAEMEVLACLDRLGPATVREVRAAMRPYRPMAHGSVVTLLRRLESKELVAREKGDVGKAFVYRALPRAARTYRDALERLRERIFGGDEVALVTSLFETRPPDEGTIEELQDLLDRLKAEREEEP